MGAFFGGLTSGKRSGGGWTGEPVVAPIRGLSSVGSASVSNNPELAMIVPTVWACVSLLANAISMMPLQVFTEDTVLGISKPAPTPQLFLTPCDDQTQSEWVHMLVVSLLTRGNAYGHIIERDGWGRPLQIRLLSPDLMHIEVDVEDNTITYRYGRNRRLLLKADVWHVRGMTMPGSRMGLSPISYAASTIGIDLASRKFAGDFFEGGGIPKAVLTSDQQIDQTQATTIKERLLAATRNREPIVLGAGLGYHALAVTPNESQFLETQKANVSQIARFFGVPPEMVGGSSGSSLTYANVEQRSIDFLIYAVQPWLRRLEDALFPLFSPRTYVRFDTTVLLRTDAETSAKIMVQNLAARVTAPSEERKKLDLPPMSDDQRIEANMVPLTINPLGTVKGSVNLKDLPGGVPQQPHADQVPLINAGVIPNPNDPLPTPVDPALAGGT